MNYFKRSLDVTKYQLIDKHIKAKIGSELDRLESSTEVAEYKVHIQDRKKGIVELFSPNFENNMNIIEENTRYKQKKCTSNNTYRKVLDKIIQKRIYNQLDNLYDSMLNSKIYENNPDLDRCLFQILDRQIRIENLLEDYDNNINLLNSHNQHITENEVTR